MLLIAVAAIVVAAVAVLLAIKLAWLILLATWAARQLPSQVLTSGQAARRSTPRRRLAGANRAASQRLAQIRSELSQPTPTRPTALASPPAPAVWMADSVTAQQTAALAGHPVGPTGQLPPWAIQPASPTLPATPAPSATIFTAPHYVRVPPPVRARVVAGSVARHGAVGTALIAFKLLVVLGFIYVLALACVITVVADQLNDQQPTTNQEGTP